MKKYWKRLLFPLLFLCLLLPAATGMAASSGKTDLISSAKKVSGGKWVSDSKGKRYRTSGGKYLKNAWIKVSGKVYRLGSDGRCETGWFTWKENTYYAAKSGQVYYGRWYVKGSSRYYLDATGARVTSSWEKINGKYYYFTKNGKLAVSRSIGQYYVTGSGVRLCSSWLKKGGKYYYYGGNGRKLSKVWIRTTKGYRYLGSDGAMAVNQWVGKYYVGSDGYRKTSCKVDGYWLDETGRRTIKVFSGDYIFVGDSRMVGMYQSVASGNSLFLAKEGSGYDWLNHTALTKLKNYLDANPDVRVVLAHGVNDLGNLGNYISCYQKLIALYPDTEFYVLSVNPVVDSYLKKEKPYAYEWVNNPLIRKFNKKLKSVFGRRYVDSYTYLKKNGYEADDGVHYTADTYQKLYRYIIEKIK